jgi:hypothetical protein
LRPALHRAGGHAEVGEPQPGPGNDFEVVWNRVLSPTDIDFIGRMYPKRE